MDLMAMYDKVHRKETLMLPEIERLDITPVQKERAQRIYDYYCGKIDQNSGSYKMGRLIDECKEFDIGSTTLYHDLKNLVDAGLLAKEGLQRPVLTMPSDDEVIEPEVVVETVTVDEEPEPEVVDDDFKPLATMEIDGWELVDEQGEKWVTSRELSKHLGYGRPDAVTQIYNEHRSFFRNVEDVTTLDIRGVDGKEREVRVFSFTGGLKVCRYSEMPAADEVMQQLIDLAEKVRKGELISVDSHIAKWQDALMVNVIQPALAQKVNRDELAPVAIKVDELEVNVDKYKVEAETAKTESQNMRLALERHERTDKIAVEVDKLVKLGIRIANDGELTNYGATWSRWGQIVKGNGSGYINVKTLRYDQVEPAMKATKQLLCEYGQEHPETIEMLKNHHPIRHKWYLDVVQDMNAEDIPF